MFANHLLNSQGNYHILQHHPEAIFICMLDTWTKMIFQTPKFNLQVKTKVLLTANINMGQGSHYIERRIKRGNERWRGVWLCKRRWLGHGYTNKNAEGKTVSQLNRLFPNDISCSPDTSALVSPPLVT